MMDSPGARRKSWMRTRWLSNSNRSFDDDGADGDDDDDSAETIAVLIVVVDNKRIG